MAHEERLKAALADRYAIESEIGSGGMATVYLAQDLRHERAIRDLQDAASTGQGFNVWTIWAPWFRPLRDDQPYQRLDCQQDAPSETLQGPIAVCNLMP